MEQKNGAIVRRLVGYGRLSGLHATYALAELYASSRLYINFFQPSFKLKSKKREGARVYKKYHAPATPCERLLACEVVNDAVKETLRRQLKSLDPMRLLRDMRVAQHVLNEMASLGPRAALPKSTQSTGDVSIFLASLATAWQDGEVRPTHRRQQSGPRYWRPRVDPFEHSWPVVEGWLIEKPTSTARELLDRLVVTVPEAYESKKQLRTLSGESRSGAHSSSRS